MLFLLDDFCPTSLDWQEDSKMDATQGLGLWRRSEVLFGVGTMGVFRWAMGAKRCLAGCEWASVWHGDCAYFAGEDRLVA